MTFLKGGRDKGTNSGNNTSNDILPWTTWITSNPLLTEKIVKDVLKATDKTLWKNIYTWGFL